MQLGGARPVEQRDRSHRCAGHRARAPAQLPTAHARAARQLHRRRRRVRPRRADAEEPRAVDSRRGGQRHHGDGREQDARWPQVRRAAPHPPCATLGSDLATALCCADRVAQVPISRPSWQDLDGAAVPAALRGGAAPHAVDLVASQGAAGRAVKRARTAARRRIHLTRNSGLACGSCEQNKRRKLGP
eukprot:2994401-Prymnesium_polylepis.1